MKRWMSARFYDRFNGTDCDDEIVFSNYKIKFVYLAYLVKDAVLIHFRINENQAKKPVIS